MQNSSEFQFVATDQIHESTTNPRLTFEQSKLEELAESIRQHGVIQPITVRPAVQGFEIVAGARRFRAAQIAELFSIPARIVELDDAGAMEWQLVENSQRVDVHPYEEAQGFQRLLEMPGYDVPALVAKSGKSASHIYSRLSLLQLIPEVAKAFVEERITASHANLIARLPQEHQATAFEQCWRKDWQDSEPHLLPAKQLTAWIETNLYLALAEAPFDREDATLNSDAGACVTCTKRSGYNTSLFADVQGDQCLDGACYQSKVAAHIDHALAENPQLVQIETAWRPLKEQRPGALPKNAYRVLEVPDNPDAEPPCPNAKTALIVFGRGAGKTVTVCIDDDCPVHDPTTAARIAREQVANPAPAVEPASDEETEEEAQARQAEYVERRKKYEAEQERLTAERKAAFERQQEEYEAEAKRREEQHKARLGTLERIVEQAPAAFNAAQLRLLVELLLNLSPYGLFEEVAEHFVGDDENHNKTDDEILSEALDACADEKLMGFVLRLVLTEHVEVSRTEQTDWLTKAEADFAPVKTKPEKDNKRPKATAAKAKSPKGAGKKKAA
jgi:ParB family transcriptional regulator, chromosome partitioning protein